MTAFSGHYVPQLSQLVYRNNKDVEKPILNFKGFMVRTLCDLFSSNELCDLWKYKFVWSLSTYEW